MSNNEVIRKKHQIGLEGTRGTGVPATHKWYAQVEYAYDRALQEFTDQSGSYSGRRIPAYLRPTIGFTSTEKFTFDDGPLRAEMMIRGGITASADAGTPIAYTRTYTPSLETDDLKSATLEFNHTGNVYESDQVMVQSWTMRIDPDTEGAWMLDQELLGRTWVPSAFTGAIADRTLEHVKAPGTKVYLSDTAFGDDQLVGKLIGASVTGNNNLHMKAFSEDELNYAANKIGRGIRTYDAQVIFEFADDTEFAMYRNADPQEMYMRIERGGTVIHDAVTNLATIDIFGYFSSWAPGDREGNLTATMGVAGYYDPVSGFDLQLELVNDQVAL